MTLPTLSRRGPSVRGGSYFMKHVKENWLPILALTYWSAHGILAVLR